MVKVLVCGDVKGNIAVLHERVEKLNDSAHGPFDLVLCAGDFYGSSQHMLRPYIAEEAVFPVPLYFVLSSTPLGALPSTKEPVELCKNITFLGRCGFEEIEGLNVAYLSGTSSDCKSAQGSTEERKNNNFKPLDVKTLIDSVISSGKRTDILLTSDKPRGVNEGSGDYEAQLAYFLQPRYHFTGCHEYFFARPPYRNVDSGNGIKVNVTRFISLAAVVAGAPKAKKWLHALKLDVEIDAALPEPSDTTDNPYASIRAITKQPGVVVDDSKKTAMKRNFEETSLSSDKIRQLMQEDEAKRNASFFYNHQKKSNNDNMRKKRRRNVIPPRMDCWFCLASPSCERHLVSSVGNCAYLALPKGGINAHHVQIIPIAHQGCFAELSEESLGEVVKYKNALKLFYSKIGCVPIFFERSVLLGKAAQRHAYLEVIPIPASSMHFAKDAFENEAKRVKLNFQDLTADPRTNSVRDGLIVLQHTVQSENDPQYFYFEIPNVVTPALHRIPPNSQGRLPLQFGRQVACRVLGCPNRVHWKECVLPQAQEAELADRFKKEFSPYDIPVDDDSDDE